MAEFMVIVVPEDPEYAPHSQGINAAIGLMEEFFPERDAEVEYKTTERPMLVTSRDAFESLRCPECGALVERFDLEEDDDGETWWDKFEQRLYASPDAQRESLEMPCCGAHVEAGKIDFRSDAAFARLNMWIHRPGDSNELSSEQVKGRCREHSGAR